jgi:hypothetical protein
MAPSLLTPNTLGGAIAVAITAAVAAPITQADSSNGATDDLIHAYPSPARPGPAALAAAAREVRGG